MAVTQFRHLGEVEMDPRGRLSMGRLHKKGPARYIVEEGPHGELRLIPVISVPLSGLPPWESRVEFQASMDRANEQIRSGLTINAGDLSQYANDNGDSEGRE